MAYSLCKKFRPQLPYGLISQKSMGKVWHILFVVRSVVGLYGVFAKDRAGTIP